MVSITKWIIIGAGLIMLGLFTKEASQTSLTGTLQRTGMAGSSIGGALSSVGTGAGNLFRGLMSPLWEVGNFAKSFGFGGDYWGNSTPDPQASSERINLTGQGGGYDDASTQGGGDTGINEEPVKNQPNWFNLNPIPQVFGEQASPGSMFDVGGSQIQTSSVHGTTLPLSQEARKWYRNIGVNVSPGGSAVSSTNPGESQGGGSNPSTGGGGGSGANFGSSGGGHASGGGFGAAN